LSFLFNFKKNQREYDSLNINNGNSNKNIFNQYKKSLIKSNLKIKILKKESTQAPRKLNSISNISNLSKINTNNMNTNNNNYNNNLNINNNVNSGNSKNGEKNTIQSINKYDSSSNNSFKVQESPVKNSNNNRANKFSANKLQKRESIVESPGYYSPEIRRKKSELDVSEFKFDFKSEKSFFLFFIN
jgi:hypothetical protein